MTRFTWLAALAVAAGIATTRGHAQEPPPLPERETRPAADDHYQPALLAEAAREYMRAGDLMSACILLWRADRLAPRDPWVEHGLRELEARLDGTFVSAEVVPTPRAAVAPPAAARGPVPPEPPPPWPVR